MAEKAELAEDDNAVSDQREAPESGKPLTTKEATDSIADLLGDDPEILDPKAKQAAEDEDDDASKDPLGSEDEDVDAETGDDKGDAPESGGKFVAATAKYKLADGTVISVGDLARNNLYQRDYSQKTEALAKERQGFEAKAKEVDQLSRHTSEERQYLIWFAENFAPKPPQPPAGSPTDDPIGHLTFNEEARRYQAFGESYRQFKTAQDQEGQRKTGETQQEAAKRAQSEVSTLFQRIKIDPQREPAKAKAFFEAIESGAKELYGLEPSQIADLVKSDHRAALVMRDAIRYHKNKSAAPKVQEKLKQVPRMLRAPTARTAPNQQQERALRSSGERLRQTGSLKDGIAAIEALIS